MPAKDWITSTAPDQWMRLFKHIKVNHLTGLALFGTATALISIGYTYKNKCLDEKVKAITMDVQNFMSAFSEENIVAMYEPCDTDPTKYRIQVHFRNNKEQYFSNDYKKIIAFFTKYADQGYSVFSLFEKIFIQQISKRLKDVSHDQFFQVTSNEIKEFLTLDSLAREAQLCKDCQQQEQKKPNILAQDMDGFKKKNRKWLTLNEEADQEKFSNIWPNFYESLASGYGSIGFEDYVTGITIRGAMTDNNGKFLLARPSSERFKEKTKLLNSLMSELKDNCSLCNKPVIQPTHSGGYKLTK